MTLRQDADALAPELTRLRWDLHQRPEVGLHLPYTQISRVLEAVPGPFAFVGAAPEGVDVERAPDNHSPYAQFDDAVMPDGAALLAELAIRRLDLVKAEAVVA
jgi:metal-dependent amidase/aminoacylase/carboxypeptidase family protein